KMLSFKHYSKIEVQDEIIEFCKGRWVAFHYKNLEKLIFRRYLNSKPIVIKKREDIISLLKKFNIRTFYATANKYKKIESIEDIHFSNAYLCTPTWDIDGKIENWQDTIKIVREILSILENEGVNKSVFIKWSGNGCHIHIHEEAISSDILNKANPLDFAYSIVEYINQKIMQKIVNKFIKIENRMDTLRVFTTPLSLHRELNVVCICFKFNEIDNFSIEWTNIENFKHNKNWREFEKGEADNLALKAYKIIGGYPLRRKRKHKKLDEEIIEWLKKL
ncbi:MAG: hypothetical protein QXF54_04235, partial [Candidatus Methanomethylicaceae archaeon]